ncbi:MAG: 4'-phosphopantetheinyl transferase family protein [Gemmatimonadaceae bacterium]
MSTTVDVWRVALDATRPPTAADLDSLSELERTRAGRFASDILRFRWLGAHVVLRRVLAAALDVPPAAITYAKGPQGKPALAHPERTGLEFNLSDSGDQALIAVSRHGPLGVDVEACRPLSDLAAVATSHFAADERAPLLALPQTEQHAAFYRIWTRKEAYLKALGEGLGYGLGRFAVTMDAADARLLHVDGDTRAGSQWHIVPIRADDGYEACVAAPWRMHDVRVHDIDLRR